MNTKLYKDLPQLDELKKPDDAFNEVTEQKRGIKSIKLEFYNVPDPLFLDK